jgi:hypothetical protein
MLFLPLFERTPVSTRNAELPLLRNLPECASEHFILFGLGAHCLWFTGLLPTTGDSRVAV